MSAFQIGVECTSQVSSWSFHPQTARWPNDSSPVFTGRLNKKSAIYFLLFSLIAVFDSCFILSSKQETVALEIAQQGRKVATERENVG